MSKLKPCPFCGKKRHLRFEPFEGSTDTGIVVCICGASYTTIEQGADWNTRPIEDALTARIAELEAAQRWIPVSERLPEATGDYIVTCDGWSNSEIAYWNFPDSDNPSGWLEYMQYIWSRKPVKYWMPLPKPPEVQE
jgi:hypothetical protein